jgi:transposase-like protein
VATDRHVRHDDGHLPAWREDSGRYFDQEIGAFLPTWEDALDAIGRAVDYVTVYRWVQRFTPEFIEAARLCRQCCIGRSVRMAERDRGRETGAVTSPRGSSVFAGFRFPREVISVAVRWYLRYGLSYRDVEEVLAERGIAVDHVTVFRWVQRFTGVHRGSSPVPPRSGRPVVRR